MTRVLKAKIKNYELELFKKCQLLLVNENIIYNILSDIEI